MAVDQRAAVRIEGPAQPEQPVMAPRRANALRSAHANDPIAGHSVRRKRGTRHPLAGKRLPEPFTPGGGYDPVAVRELGVVGSVAQPLFNEYLLGFELTSILLLVAIVGAVVIGRRRQTDAR